MNIYEESLQFHKQLRGKLEVSSRVKITNEKDLKNLIALAVRDEGE